MREVTEGEGWLWFGEVRCSGDGEEPVFFFFSFILQGVKLGSKECVFWGEVCMSWGGVAFEVARTVGGGCNVCKGDVVVGCGGGCHISIGGDSGGDGCGGRNGDVGGGMVC